MNPQFLYTLVFFTPFILLIIIGFCIAKKLIKAALWIFVIALILFFGFSIRISPLDYFFNYNQEVDSKSINLGKYTITFGQTATEKFYNSYIKILNNETSKESVIEFDPKSGKYWNVRVKTDGNKVCFSDSNKQLFCIDKSNWSLNINEEVKSIPEIEANSVNSVKPVEDNTENKDEVNKAEESKESSDATEENKEEVKSQEDQTSNTEEI